MSDLWVGKDYYLRGKGQKVQDKPSPMAISNRSWPFARYLRPELPQLLAQTINAE